MDWSEWRALLLPWLPLAATVGGWAVVNWQNNQRERRKEDRALVDGAKKLTIEAAAKARAMMCAASRDQEAELEVKCVLEQLEIELCRLSDYRRNWTLVRTMAALADAATGGDFESANWRPRTAVDPEPKQLMAARNTLLEQLELDFARRYL